MLCRSLNSLVVLCTTAVKPSKITWTVCRDWPISQQQQNLYNALRWLCSWTALARAIYLSPQVTGLLRHVVDGLFQVLAGLTSTSLKQSVEESNLNLFVEITCTYISKSFVCINVQAEQLSLSCANPFANSMQRYTHNGSIHTRKYTHNVIYSYTE